MLEAVYAAGSKAEEKTKAQVRMTLKANLAKNAKRNAESAAAAGGKHRRIMSVAVKDVAAWGEPGDMRAANPAEVGRGGMSESALN